MWLADMPNEVEDMPNETAVEPTRLQRGLEWTRDSTGRLEARRAWPMVAVQALDRLNVVRPARAGAPRCGGR